MANKESESDLSPIEVAFGLRSKTLKNMESDAGMEVGPNMESNLIERMIFEKPLNLEKGDLVQTSIIDSTLKVESIKVIRKNGTEEIIKVKRNAPNTP